MELFGLDDSKLSLMFDYWERYVLLRDVEHADEYLIGAIIFLCVLAIFQHKVNFFAHPPPVALKKLPSRPALSIWFKPDEADNEPNNNSNDNDKNNDNKNDNKDYINDPENKTSATGSSSMFYFKSSTGSVATNNNNNSNDNDGTGSTNNNNNNNNINNNTTETFHQRNRSFGGISLLGTHTPPRRYSGYGSSAISVGSAPMEDSTIPHNIISQQQQQQQPFDKPTVQTTTGTTTAPSSSSATTPSPPPQPGATAGTTTPPPFFYNAHSQDLPDSFAPLLSSSQTEVLLHELTANLIHGVNVECGIRMRPGRHEIPLDKDASRPQFVLNVPKQTGCRMTAVATIGSDKLSTREDLNPNIPTTARSLPMVKNASVVLDPPLFLSNVAPTLIHFPTLFEDRQMVPALRRNQILRFVMESIISLSSFIERILWIIESFLHIHLAQVQIRPLYKGRKKKSKQHQHQQPPSNNSNEANKTNNKDNKNKNVDNDPPLPEWHLSLAFSGHVLLCGWIPIPFISVVLPSFIIPQPHALLESLLTKQPLASAKVKHEKIGEEAIALAVLNSMESWNVNCQVVATPPAVGIDLTLPGGVSLGVELMHGRDATGRKASGSDSVSSVPPMSTDHNIHANNSNIHGHVHDARSVDSYSSWTTSMHNRDTPTGQSMKYQQNLFRTKLSSGLPYDANTAVPWSVDVSIKGSVSQDRISFHIMNFSLRHEDLTAAIPTQSQFVARGSFAVWKVGHGAKEKMMLMKKSNTDSTMIRRTKSSSFAHRAALAGTATESPSVAGIFLFPTVDQYSSSFHREVQMLQYDYAFDVWEESKIDAVTLSIGANHPMLNGGSMITTILESIYAFGSVTAREDAILDPMEQRRKRNILRHLPAIDFTFGIQNMFIPPESMSYTDDGQTHCIPQMEGGRIMARFLGGIGKDETVSSAATAPTATETKDEELTVADGIKIVAEFGISSMIFNNETRVKEFPELDIFEGAKLRSLYSGKLDGCVNCHLRPQKLAAVATASTTGPNIFNPLEAYEIVFSGSSLSLKLKEGSTTLGHRRLIVPTETSIAVKVVESVVDMTLEGKTQCELSWDFQGLSPILQVTEVGQSPEDAMHENKEHVALLIAPLRQGRFNFHVSSVGGINITKAVTSREDKEGLYDWKFFNALVSPDQKSAERLLQVVHDRRTMEKLLQVIRLINTECHKFLSYLLKQIWRAREIFDQEGVSDPGHAIPGHKMARLISLFMCGDASQVPEILPLIRRVVAGDGLDVVKVKDLLRKHCAWYDEWAPELDRCVRWVETMFSPMQVPQPYVEKEVVPLAELPHYASRFCDIPSARQLYEQIHDRPHLPLDVSFSRLVNRVAPYLTFRQIEYFLKVRSSTDWQPSDLKRIRYVYSVKRKVLEIAESYGGLSFLPQSFLVSVFLGEATRASLRAADPMPRQQQQQQDQLGQFQSQSYAQPRDLPIPTFSSKPSTLATLRVRRTRLQQDPSLPNSIMGGRSNSNQLMKSRVFSENNFLNDRGNIPEQLALTYVNTGDNMTNVVPGQQQQEQYELGDSLLGPNDVAILLQAGLTSVMKGSSVVQLNQRMLLDLVNRQPKSFAVAVLAEIGTPGGQGSPRGLTSALMALLELDQGSFRPANRLDMHALLESWLPGLKVPKREDYMAGGRWARQSYYEAIFSLATNILEDAECYMALKGHIQRDRKHKETDSIPRPREEIEQYYDQTIDQQQQKVSEMQQQTPQTRTRNSTKLKEAIEIAKDKIKTADEFGSSILQSIVGEKVKDSDFAKSVTLYEEAFDACVKVRAVDKLSFQAKWFANFYRRNYDALMILSIYENAIDDVDNVRYWLQALRNGAKYGAPLHPDGTGNTVAQRRGNNDKLFMEPDKVSKQKLVDAILDAIIYEEDTRENMRKDPLVRLLIPNKPGKYNFTVVTAMGVITDGKAGLELKAALDRLKEKRGVETIRADTATARSFEYNAGKIIEAIEAAQELKKPFGLIGYSQGCANTLMAESMLLSGPPLPRRDLKDPRTGLVCRQLLFSAANGSRHGPATDTKVQRLIVMCEEFFKYQQGYFSRALQTTFLEILNSIMDSAAFQKFMGGAQSMLPEGCRVFWREAQHLSHVPTCTLRGVLEEHTTPECLEMLSKMLEKQSGSALHDSQVHVYDAVGYPVYHRNRNGRILENCDVGKGAIQRTHHWSPLSDEVEFVATQRDQEIASFDCAKDRHVFPWVDVNVRFGFMGYVEPPPPQQQQQQQDNEIDKEQVVSAENAVATPSDLSAIDP